ncbi:DNA ligase [Cohnella boryungensis]|uniref:DNA ligase (ATP) n=1 Tax=Cohnella boryungensis TaxID=768479 RepID=A0ABV8S4D6_9BACL
MIFPAKPIVPFEPVSVIESPQGEDWVGQIKWDGVRMLAYVSGGSARLFNRRLHERTLQYPEFADAAAYGSAESLILDGEMIAFDKDIPSFRQIMRRDSLRQEASIAAAVSRIPAIYVVFDLLLAEGNWVTERPLAERQSLLSRFVRESERVQLCRNFTDSSALFERMKQLGMEGIVCKSLSSAYGIGLKDNRWRKLKITQDLIAAVGGVTYNGNRVNALLLGVFDESGALHYIGHVGTGKLTRQDWLTLTEQAPSLVSAHMTFAERPDRYKDATWVKPHWVAKVQFLEWTPGGVMRQPSIQALLPAAALSECSAKQIAR